MSYGESATKWDASPDALQFGRAYTSFGKRKFHDAGAQGTKMFKQIVDIAMLIPE